MSKRALVVLLIGANFALLTALGLMTWDLPRADAQATPLASNFVMVAAEISEHHDALFVHGIRNCNLLESPAIVSTYATLSGISGESRLSASDEQFLAVEQETSVPAPRFSDSWFCRPHDFSSGFAAVRSGVLRI